MSFILHVGDIFWCIIVLSMSQEEEIARIITPHLMGKHKKDKALELAKEIIDYLNKSVPNPNS